MQLKTKIKKENRVYWNIKIILLKFEYLSLTVTGSSIIADSSLLVHRFSPFIIQKRSKEAEKEANTLLCPC